MIHLKFDLTYGPPKQWTQARTAYAAKLMLASKHRVLPESEIPRLRAVLDYRKNRFEYEDDITEKWFEIKTRRAILKAGVKAIVPYGNCNDFPGLIAGDLINAGYDDIGFFRALVMRPGEVLQDRYRNFRGRGHMTGIAETEAGFFVMDFRLHTDQEINSGLWDLKLASMAGSDLWQRASAAS